VKSLVVLAHPSPGSFNHALAALACTRLRRYGHDVTFHDLYAEGFDPCLPAGEIAREAELPAQVRAHCGDLQAADGIVIVHPNWWGQPPAIMKGWIDRVFRPGVAYRFAEGDAGEGVPIGLLRARTALVFNTSNTPVQREHEVFGDPLAALWQRCIFALCGVPAVEQRMFGVVVTSTAAERAAWLAQAAALIDHCFPGGA
jgi:NAD(P)H dehydrogenase (quinone)